MGVFTTGRQVALEIDMPGWWLANSSVDMDFRRGLYYDHRPQILARQKISSPALAPPSAMPRM